MSETKTVLEGQRDEIIANSIEQRRAVVLTHRSQRGWRTYRAQMVGTLGEPPSILFKVPMPDGHPTSGPLEPGETVGITFRLGHKKCMYASVLETVDSQFDHVLIATPWPNQIRQLQRRVYERVAPARGNVVAVRFWLVDDNADSVQDNRDVRHGQLEDISAGGMRLKVANPQHILEGHTYRCVFAPRPGAAPIIVEATLRHREDADGGRASLGFQFIGLETCEDGQRTLDRIARVVSQYQRGNRRRKR